MIAVAGVTASTQSDQAQWSSCFVFKAKTYMGGCQNHGTH